MKRDGYAQHNMVRLIFSAFLLIVTAACVGPERPAPRPPKPIAAPPRVIPPPRPVVVAPRPVPPPGATSQFAPAAMVQGIQALWAAYPDRAGIAVLRDGAPWSIEHRGGEPMPQQSVSKLWVAITIMQGIDDGRWALSDQITVRASDLTVFSRAANAKVGPDGWQTTIAELLTLAMTRSDNTANNVLLIKAGGTEAVRAMIAAKGLGAIRFGGPEHILQSGTAGLTWREEYRPGQGFQIARAKLSEETRRAAMTRYVTNPPDGAAPLAIARALLRLKRGELLSAASTRHLLGLMADSETGRARLKGGVPYDWGFAHKTGTGQDYGGRTAGYNDVGILTAPDGTNYAVVVMIAEAYRPVPERQQLMQGVTATVTANHIR
jgi:beta-lactamase class A